VECSAFNMKVIDGSRLIDSSYVSFVDKVMKTRNELGLWETIDLLVDYWSKENPTVYDSFVIEVGKKRDTRATEYGSDKNKNLRSVLDIPDRLIRMIRVIYNSEELKMDKEFFNKFWKRYAVFRVAEKL
jgi:hypothetical protein